MIICLALRQRELLDGFAFALGVLGRLLGVLEDGGDGLLSLDGLLFGEVAPAPCFTTSAEF